MTPLEDNTDPCMTVSHVQLKLPIVQSAMNALMNQAEKNRTIPRTRVGGAGGCVNVRSKTTYDN